MWVTDGTQLEPYRKIIFSHCPNCGVDMTVKDEPEPMDDDALMELFGNVKEQLDRLSVITANLSKGEG